MLYLLVNIGYLWLIYKPILFRTPKTSTQCATTSPGASLALVSVGTLNRKAHGLQLPIAWPAEPTLELKASKLWGKRQISGSPEPMEVPQPGGLMHLEQNEKHWRTGNCTPHHSNELWSSCSLHNIIDIVIIIIIVIIITISILAIISIMIIILIVIVTIITTIVIIVIL